MSSIDRVLAPTFAAQRGVVSRSQAIAAGATAKVIRNRVDRRIWRQELPGVLRLEGAPRTWRQKLMAACLWSDGYVSHRGAAALFKLPNFEEGIVEITTNANVRARNVQVHRSQDMARPWITTQEGIPLTTAARTIVDLCAVVPRRQVEESFDVLLARRLITPERQWTCMNRMGTRGRCGTALLRSVVAERMGLGSIRRSIAETRFSRVLSESSLPRPKLQFEVRDDRFRAELDAAWPEIKLGVEIESWEWHSSKSARFKDARRQNRLELLGWTILRFFYEDVVCDPDYVLAELAAVHARLNSTFVARRP